MDGFEKITQFDIKLKKETVFHLIDCYPDSPIYDEVSEEYDRIESRILQLIRPRAFFKFGIVSTDTAEHAAGAIAAGSSVIFTLSTIGDEVAKLSSKYFEKGDYLLGMLANAMSDTYLFQMDDVLTCHIKASCNQRHLGVTRRLEAPQDIPMLVQKDILEEIKKIENLSIDVTEGYMFTTVKTTGYILELTADEKQDHSGHSCSTCSQMNCKLRKV